MDYSLAGLARALYSGVDFSLPGNGGPACRSYLGTGQRLAETALVLVISTVCIRWGLRRLHPPTGRSFIRKDRGGRRLLLVITSLVFGAEVAFKFASRQLIYLLNPCHVTTVAQIVLLSLPPSTHSTVLFRLHLYFLNGAVLALLFPVTNTLLLPFECELFYIQHTMMLVVPYYLLRLGGVYNIERVSDISWAVVGGALQMLYNFGVLQFFSMWSLANLNSMLCPAISDPFSGRWYRVAAFLHQSLFIPLCGKLYCLASDFFITQVNSQQQFKVDPLPLKTIRPFIFEEIVLSEFDIDEEVRQLKGKMEEVKENNAHDMLMKGNLWGGAKGKGGRGRRAGEILPQSKIKVNPVEVFIEHRVRELLKKTKVLQTGHPKQPTLPLVRIRVVYTEEEQMFNACRFGYRFEGLVANTEDVVIFAREKAERGTKTEGLASALPDNLINVDDVNSTVEELVEEIFKSGSLPGCEMHLLTERGMGSAVTAFVEKADKHALTNMIDHQMKRTQDYIVSLDKEYDNPDDLEADIQAFKAMRCTDIKLQREEEEFLETFQSTGASGRSSVVDSDDDSPPDIGSLVSSDSDGDAGSKASPSGRGRGSRGGRASTRGKTSTSTRGRRGRGRI